jgi:hypothetical protein
MAYERDVSLIRTAVFGFLVLFGIPSAALLTQTRNTAPEPAQGVKTATREQLRLEAKKADGVLTVLEDHFGISVLPEATESERMATLVQRVRARDLQFMIATVPDPIESQVSLLFDPALDAIQSAAAEGKLALQRFWLPIEPENKSTGEGQHLRRGEPGAVVFRGSDTLLVVLLVPETPTGGVDRLALDRAIELIMLKSCLSINQDLRILGPFFTGTTDSLVRALADWQEKLPNWRVRVISGSASSLDNQRQFRAKFKAEELPFHATSIPDEELQRAMETYINAREPDPRVALLVEANTWFGLQASTRDMECKADKGELPPPFCRALRIPYPLHISRSRPARERANETARLTGAQPLSLEATHGASDRIPPMTPATTEPSMDLALLNLLRTLQSESINVVGLVATDWRDKLFLATKIAEHCPGIRIFTTRADLPYAHPDYVRATRGMLVASTYSGFVESQLWLGTNKSRRQFAHAPAQGIYNAFLLLMFYNERGIAKNPAQPPALAEYHHRDRACVTASQDDESCRPGVWISVVGNGALFPLGYNTVATKEAKDYLAPYRPGKYSNATSVERLFGRLDLTLSVTLLLFLHVCAYVYTRRTTEVEARKDWRTWRVWAVGDVPFVRRCCVDNEDEDEIAADENGDTGDASNKVLPRSPHQRHIYAAVALVALLPVCLMITALTVVHIQAFGKSQWYVRPLSIFSAVTFLLLLIAAIHAGVLFSRRPADPCRKELAEWSKAETRRALGLCALGCSALVMLVIYVVSQVAGLPAWACAWQDGLDRLDGSAFLARAQSLTSGVSPVVPVLSLSATVYLWAMMHLRRSGMPRAGGVENRLHSLEKELRTEASKDAKEPKYVSCTKKAANRLRGTITPAVLVTIGVSLLILQPVLRTIDGRLFDWFYLGAFIVVQVLLVVTLVRFSGVWIALRRFLQLLESHRLLDAFERLPQEMRTTRTLAWTPHIDDVGPMVKRWKQVQPLLVQHPDVFVEWKQCRGPRPPEPPSLAEIRHDFEEERGSYAMGAWATSKALREMRKWDAEIWKLARARWARGAGSRKPQREGRNVLRARTLAISIGGQEAVKRDSREDVLEEFVALETLLSIRDVLGRMVNSVVFVALANLLVIVSHTMYVVQPAQLLFTISALNIVGAAVVVLPVLTQTERNEVLSKITGTTPGQLAWDWTFVYRIVVYGILPGVVLLASQFPAVWGSVLDWVTSFRQALP